MTGGVGQGTCADFNDDSHRKPPDNTYRHYITKFSVNKEKIFEFRLKCKMLLQYVIFMNFIL